MDLQHSVTIVVNWEELSRVKYTSTQKEYNHHQQHSYLWRRLRESTLFVIEPVKIYHNTAQDGGGAYSSRVEFQPSVPMVYAFGRLLPPNKQSEIAHNIAKNNGGGIHAVSSTIKLTRSYVNIDSNTANASGGGVYLQQSSKLYLLKNYVTVQLYYVKLLINNNSAQYGGGIFVAHREVHVEEGPQKLKLLELFLLTASFKQLNCMGTAFIKAISTHS